MKRKLKNIKWLLTKRCSGLSCEIEKERRRHFQKCVVLFSLKLSEGKDASVAEPRQETQREEASKTKLAKAKAFLGQIKTAEFGKQGSSKLEDSGGLKSQHLLDG